MPSSKKREAKEINRTWAAESYREKWRGRNEEEPFLESLWNRCVGWVFEQSWRRRGSSDNISWSEALLVEVVELQRGIRTSNLEKDLVTIVRCEKEDNEARENMASGKTRWKRWELFGERRERNFL